METNETILKTSIYNIGGEDARVETIKGTGRQDISYRVNGKHFTYEDFWKLNPIFKASPLPYNPPTFASILAARIFGSVTTKHN